MDTENPAKEEGLEEDVENIILRGNLVAVAFPVNLCFVFTSYSNMMNPISDDSDEVITYLDSMRFYFHSLLYIGFFTSYVRTRGAFYHGLLAFFYANSVVCLTILAWKSPNILNTLHLVALSVAGTVHAISLPILLRYAGEKEIEVRRTDFPKFQLEWLTVFQRFQMLEVLFAFGSVVENLTEDTEPGLVLNSAAHASVLPAFGYFCWKCMVHKSETAKGAALFYGILLLLTMPQRLVQAVVARSIVQLGGFLLNCCQLFALGAALYCGGEEYKCDLAKALEGSLVRLPISNPVNLNDKSRPTWYFDNTNASFPRLKFKRWSVRIHAVSTFVLCMSWVVVGFQAIALKSNSGVSKVTQSVYAMNASGHGLVLLGFLYFCLSDYFGIDRSKFNMSVLANIGYFILSCLTLWKATNKMVHNVSLVQLFTTGLNLCLLVYIHCVPYTTFERVPSVAYDVVHAESSSGDNDGSLRLRQGLLVSTLLVILVFSLLGGFVLVGNDGSFKHARADVVQELMFHFGFLLPVLSWTGMLVNHRLNLAFASYGGLYIAGTCVVSALVLYVQHDLTMSAVFFLSALTCFLFAVLNKKLRKQLFEMNAPQGHVVWGRR